MSAKWLTDEECDTLRDWWDEETTVGVESAFPIISRMVAARLAPIEALADEWEQRAIARGHTGLDSSAHAASDLRAVLRSLGEAADA